MKKYLISAVIICITIQTLVFGHGTRYSRTGEPGHIVNWGRNERGQAQSPFGSDYIALSSGGDHGIAIKQDGTLMTWGYDSQGQVTDYPLGDHFIAVAAGNYHSLAIQDTPPYGDGKGKLYGWGLNSRGQTNCPSGENWVQIVGGSYGSMGLRDDGTVAVWGFTYGGANNTPPPVSMSNVKTLAAQGYRRQFMRNDGTMEAWTTGGVMESPSGTFEFIGGGWYWHMGIRHVPGQIETWGGDRGYDFCESSPCTLPPDFGNDFIDCSGGQKWILGIKSDWTLKTYGSNVYGQISGTPTYPVLGALGGYETGVALVEGPDPKLAGVTVPGDMNGDGTVDAIDLGMFAAQWLNSGCGTCGGADIDGDSDVDLKDFSGGLAQNWLSLPAPLVYMYVTRSYTREGYVNSPENDGNCKFCAGKIFVQRVGEVSSLSEPLTVNFEITGGTATEGLDYLLPTRSVTIPAGRYIGAIDIEVIDDAIVEAECTENDFVDCAESVTVGIMPSTNGSYRIYQPRSQSTMYISDEFTADTARSDDEPSKAVAAVHAVTNTIPEEGPAGAITISHTGDTGAPFIVRYNVSGTATKGTDYITLSGSVTIPAGQSSANVAISPINDGLMECDENIIITISSDPTYDIDSSASSVDISLLDDECVVPVVTIAATTPVTREGGSTAGQFTVTRTTDVNFDSPLTVLYTASGSAAIGSDYTALSGSVTIAANQATATIAVTPLDDATKEADEQVSVKLASNAAYRMGTPKEAGVVIKDNDWPTGWGALRYDNFEGESGCSWGNFLSGGAHAMLYSGPYAAEGTCAANLENQQIPTSTMSYANAIDVATPGYTQLKLEFTFKAIGFTSDKFYVEYYNGTAWVQIAKFEKGKEFLSNDTFYPQEITIAESTYAFPANMNIRFRCTSSADTKDVYIDSVMLSAYPVASEDTTAPSPDPMTWATVPHSTGQTSIAMTATTATDSSGVEYFFDCVSGSCHDSSWQSSAIYTDTGLTAGTTYSYQVIARDKSAYYNQTAPSVTGTATTDSGGGDDTAAPSPNPMTWATVPHATSSTSIEMTAAAAADSSGVEYFFDCVSGDGHDSSWQDSSVYADIGLTASTEYSYQVIARDKSINHNQTTPSAAASATTDAGGNDDTTAPTPDPMMWAVEPHAANSTSIEMTAAAAADSSGVEYFFDCVSGGCHDSSWQESPEYTDNGLSAAAVYSYQVMARDKSTNHNQTAPSITVAAATQLQATSLFLEDFEGSKGFAGWNIKNGTYGKSTGADAYSGSYGGYLKKDASAQKNISTAGMTNVHIKYVGKTKGYASSKYLTVEWSPDGSTWNVLDTIADTAWVSRDIACGTGADNKSGFAIRVKGGGTLNTEFAYLDNIEVIATLPDTVKPFPDPMTWAVQPHATGSTTIAMTATTAADSSGVEYFFDCVSGSGHDSLWQDSPSYVDTGLSASTKYSYQVKARDKSPNQNQTAASSTVEATTEKSGSSDYNPPVPDPLVWAEPPHATGPSSVEMTAVEATDDTGSVEYFFDCVSGSCHDSDWQDSPSYTDMGLSESTEYSYQVKARDKSANQNQTAPSDAVSAVTPADTTAPSPDPMVWDVLPYATGSTSIAMAAATATDDTGGVEYFFDCVSGDCHDRDWQDNPNYTDTGLSAGIGYSYQVKARDKSANHNQTAASIVASAATTPQRTAFFTEDFESTNGFTGWSLKNGSYGKSTGADAYSGTYGGYLKNQAWAQKNISTAGKTDIHVKYARKTKSYAAGKYMTVEWSPDGSTWNTLETTADTAWAVKDIACGSGADNKSGFAIRFKGGGTLNTEFAYADDIQVTNAPVDNAKPAPDPMMWAIPPSPTGMTSIEMTAVTAADYSGVEYFFDCVSGGCHDSSWQDSPTYTDTGLSQATGYSYQVKARDKSVNHNQTALSAVGTTATLGDLIAPTPNPLTWAVPPSAAGPDSIAMTATTAADDTSSVEYFFDCVSGDCHDSSWQTSPAYTDTGLSAGTEYSYQVKARDTSSNYNETALSDAASATTLADITAPSPDPMVWAVPPYATGTTSIAMTAAAATDSSGVEYFFDCVSGSCHDSNWQDSQIYTDTGLVAGMEYSYQVIARDKSPNQNQTAASEVASAATNALITVLFSEDFESSTGFAGWNAKNGSYGKSTGADAYSGTYGGYLKSGAWAQKNISTAGKTNVRVKYVRKTENYASGKYLTIEWSPDGSTWNTLETTADTIWVSKDMACGAGADNKSGFAIRIKGGGTLNTEFAYVDDIQVTSTP